MRLPYLYGKKNMGMYSKVPEDFDQLVYMGLVLQGVGVRQGLEALSLIHI